MQKYFGLRLLRTFFIALAGLIAIFSLVATATMISNGTIDMMQALAIVLTSGVVSLLLYAFAQIIDIHIRNYQTSWRVLRQTAKANELNNQILQVLGVQLELMKIEFKMGDDNEVNAIIKQIQLRRERLEKEYD